MPKCHHSERLLSDLLAIAVNYSVQIDLGNVKPEARIGTRDKEKIKRVIQEARKSGISEESYKG